MNFNSDFYLCLEFIWILIPFYFNTFCNFWFLCNDHFEYDHTGCSVKEPTKFFCVWLSFLEKYSCGIEHWFLFKAISMLIMSRIEHDWDWKQIIGIKLPEFVSKSTFPFPFLPSYHLTLSLIAPTLDLIPGVKRAEKAAMIIAHAAPVWLDKLWPTTRSILAAAKGMKMDERGDRPRHKTTAFCYSGRKRAPEGCRVVLEQENCIWWSWNIAG